MQAMFRADKKYSRKYIKKKKKIAQFLETRTFPKSNVVNGTRGS